MIHLRTEVPKDKEAVYSVNEQAFGRPDEAELVERLRPLDGTFISLVAEKESAVVGHVLFNPVTVGLHRATALGPVAVLPAFQGQGVGTKLIYKGLDLCRVRGEKVVFVLGHPEYYPRFGFELAAPKGLFFDPPHTDAAFFVLDLIPGASDALTGRVVYPSAFSEV